MDVRGAYYHFRSENVFFHIILRTDMRLWLEMGTKTEKHFV